MRHWLLGQRDDTRDALITAALAESPDAVAAWHRLVTTRLEVEHDGVVARWLPLVYRNIGRHLSDPASLDILQQADKRSWAFSIRLLTAASPVVTAFRAANIDFVLLKGAALASTVYPHPGVRPFGDVDILVRPDAFDAARDVVVAAGWHEVPSSGALADEVTHARAFAGPVTGAIDLHRFLLPDCQWPGVDDTLWQRTTTTSSEALEARILGPADQLLHVAVHGLRWSPVHAGTWVADAAYLIRHAGETLDWNALVDEARRRGFSYQAREALRLVRRLGRVDVPERVCTALSRQSAFLEPLECRVRVRPVTGVGGLLMYWFGWRRNARGRGAAPRGFVEDFAGRAGLARVGQLRGWVIRFVRRRWHRRSGPDGRSKRPVLPG